MNSMLAVPSRNVAGLLFTALALAGTPARRIPGDRAAVSVKLSEWKVELSSSSITAGPVTFTVTNTGTIPHAFEVEGQGIEQETTVIQPGSSATLTLTLKPGTYEAYCPVGNDSHKKLGMQADLKVVRAAVAAPPPYDDAATREPAPKVQAIRVMGGGTVIQILPGPFPFPDSAAPILQQFGDEREGLESQVKNGPYSNNVTPARAPSRSRLGTRARCATRWTASPNSLRRTGRAGSSCSIACRRKTSRITRDSVV